MEHFFLWHVLTEKQKLLEWVCLNLRKQVTMLIFWTGYFKEGPGAILGRQKQAIPLCYSDRVCKQVQAVPCRNEAWEWVECGIW